MIVTVLRTTGRVHVRGTMYNLLYMAKHLTLGTKTTSNRPFWNGAVDVGNINLNSQLHPVVFEFPRVGALE
jgi:hypothetical protein